MRCFQLGDAIYLLLIGQLPIATGSPRVGHSVVLFGREPQLALINTAIVFLKISFVTLFGLL